MTRGVPAAIWGAWALAVIGVAGRVAPLFDQGGRLWRQFPTEDGYLMLTIARNLARGHGMSIADGTIPTNGTQPLATLLWSACFWLVDGDRYWGAFGVQVLEIAIALASAWLLFRLGLRAFASSPHARALAALAAAAWLASPVVLRHSMNCLESGLYVLLVLLVLLAVLPPEPAGRESAGALGAPAPGIDLTRWAAIGALLGLCFWARNDAVLLCLVVGGGHLLGILPGPRAHWSRRLVEGAAAATVVSVLALPWLLNNWMRFGSPVPISGQAEALRATFGGNLWVVAVKLFEYLTLFLPIPAALEPNPLVITIGAVLVGVVALAGVRSSLRLDRWPRALVWVGAAFTLALAAFYGLYFGAGHFMSRYLFPTSPLFALLLVFVLAQAFAHLPRLGRLTWLAVPALVVLASGLHLRVYWNGSSHQHFQVVEWVAANVPEDAWVGAVQTGTLGYFHDRTINLDGKVNPYALEARRTNDVPSYVAAGQITYLADWAGIEGWLDRREIAENFELVLVDSKRNLAVLRRTTPLPLAIDAP